MSEHDYIIANDTGAAVRADINNMALAIVSNNSKATEPSTTYAYMPWADTANDLMKVRNAANTAWVDLYTLSTGAPAVSSGVTSAQIQGQTYQAFTTGGTSTAYTLTPSPALGSYVAGQRFNVTFHTTAGTTPTLNISSLGAKNLKVYDSSGVKQAVTASDVITNMICDVVYDGTDIVVLNKTSGSAPEYGSWTPVLGGSGGTSGQTYSIQSGQYAKIGKVVIAQFAITLTAKGTITGTVQMQGLPATASSATNDQGGCVFHFIEGLSLTSKYDVHFSVVASSSVATMRATDFSTSANLVTGNITNTTALRGVIIYIADA